MENASVLHRGRCIARSSAPLGPFSRHGGSEEERWAKVFHGE